MKIYGTFDEAINCVAEDLAFSSYEVDNNRWQSSDVSETPGHNMRELFNRSFQVIVGGTNLTDHAKDIKPNLPWADDHFLERVGGVPLNPGKEWKNWPYANRANTFRKDQKFSHTYMERYWPKEAGKITAHGGEWNNGHGIRYELGDLNDVVDLLYREPETRQAFLPVWFPEDTGVTHGERVPCTLGYHFMKRNEFFHMTYYIRSCDFTRHFRDDLYLSLRLQLWILEKLQSRDMREAALGELRWRLVKPGFFVFHCASMHIFENDHKKLCNDITKQKN